MDISEELYELFLNSVKLAARAKSYREKAKKRKRRNRSSAERFETLESLKDKLQALQEDYSFKKAANQCIRRKNKVRFLTLPGATIPLWNKLRRPNKFHQRGFSRQSLTKDGVRIIRLQLRIQQKEKFACHRTNLTELNGVLLVENVEAKRMQLFFNGKPIKPIRDLLEKNRFKWCAYRLAWQRPLSDTAVTVARNLISKINPQ